MSKPNSRSSRSRRDTLIRRSCILAVCLALIAAMGLAVRPAYRAFRNHRIEKTLDAAEEAARLEDWQVARDSAKSVLILDPSQFGAFRIWARALARTEDPNACLAAKGMIGHPKATREDRLEALRTLASQGPQALALGAYFHLGRTTEPDGQADLRAAIAPVLLFRGQAAAAEQGLMESMSESPSPDVRLALIRVIVATPTDARLQIARQHLATLIEQGAITQALDALELLGFCPHGLDPGPPLPNLRSWVLQQPRAKVIHHLLALNPELAADPAGADATFHAAVSRFASLDPATTAKWLVFHKKEEKALEILAGPAKERSDAYVSRIHLLLYIGRTKELQEALTSPPAAADMIEVEMVRAVAATRRGDTPASAAAWTRALDHASFDTRRNRFITIARCAEAYGASAAAEDAWVAAVRTGWGRLPLYSDLAPHLLSLGRQGRSEDLLALTRGLVQFEPLNIDLINDSLYLGLLHDAAQPSDIRASLEKLLAEHPAKVELNSTLMFADLAMQDPQRALERFQVIKDSPRVSPSMKELLESTALAMQGNVDRVHNFLSGKNRELVMQRERDVFAKLLKQSSKDQGLNLSLAEWTGRKVEVDLQKVPAWRKSLERTEQQKTLGQKSQEELPELPEPGFTGSSGTDPKEQ